MKTMKRVISSALLLCMLAALLSVSAFAAGGSVDLTANVYEIDEGSGAIVSLSAKLNHSDLSQLNDRPVKWYKNGALVKEEVTIDGFGSASFGEGAFNTGANIIKVEITAIDEVTYSNEITIVKHEAPKAKVVTLDKSYATVDLGGTLTLTATVDGVPGNEQVSWISSNPNIASVANGTVTGVQAGQATIVVADLINGVEYARCTVTVTDPAPAGSVVTISPIVTQLQKNQSINIRASVTGTGRFDHWYVADNMGSYVTIANTNSENTTLTARVATNVPIRLFAYSDDGASAYIEFTIVAAESLRLEASPASISYGQISDVYVVNPFGGEEFTWSITPSASYGVLASSNNMGDSVKLTAGSVEGRIVVSATSKADTTRTASVTVYVNSEASYGAASINPNVATWTSGKLTFEVYPAFYKAYVDGKLLTANSGYYTYYNGILTLNPSLLASLSNGEHSLKVYTSSGNGVDGLVYATIYVNKVGTASSVYGDNAHVRGSSYNLYFTSTEPIQSVYISNQWIDPANYSLDATGTRLTLNSNFLNQLGYGSYTMKLVTQNGYTETANFRIVTANYAPATGDDGNIGAWMILLTISCAGAIALIPKKKKSTDLIG